MAVHYVTPGSYFFQITRLTLVEEERLQPLDVSEYFLLVGFSVFSTEVGSGGGGQREGKSSHEALIPNMDLS